MPVTGVLDLDLAHLDFHLHGAEPHQLRLPVLAVVAKRDPPPDEEVDEPLVAEPHAPLPDDEGLVVGLVAGEARVACFGHEVAQVTDLRPEPVVLDRTEEVGDETMLLSKHERPLPEVPGTHSETPGTDLAPRRPQEEAGVGGARDWAPGEAGEILDDFLLSCGGSEEEWTRYVAFDVRSRFREHRGVADAEKVFDDVQTSFCCGQVHDSVAVDGGLLEVSTLFNEVLHCG